MNTALFNERILNGGDQARTIVVRAATVVSRRMVRQCDSRSAVSVCGDLLLEPATRVNVQHVRCAIAAPSSAYRAAGSGNRRQ